MARSVNNVILMGNLTRDPELRQTPTGRSVTNFSLALNSAYRDQNDQWQEKTDFVDVVCWAQLAERVSQYMSKGRRCLVQGRLQSRNWEQDGQKRTKVEVVANDVTFLDGGAGGQRDNNDDSSDDYQSQSSSSKKSDSDNNASPKKAAKADTQDDEEPINLDDIPF